MFTCMVKVYQRWHAQWIGWGSDNMIISHYRDTGGPGASGRRGGSRSGRRRWGWRSCESGTCGAAPQSSRCPDVWQSWSLWECLEMFWKYCISLCYDCSENNTNRPGRTSVVSPLSAPGQWNVTNSWHLLCSTKLHTENISMSAPRIKYLEEQKPLHWYPCFPNPLEWN